MYPVQTTESFSLFFFNDTATTEIYTLSLHDALPISLLPETAVVLHPVGDVLERTCVEPARSPLGFAPARNRSEEHTSELQSHSDLVCRLLLEKKNTYNLRVGDGNADLLPVAADSVRE